MLVKEIVCSLLETAKAKGWKVQLKETKNAHDKQKFIVSLEVVDEKESAMVQFENNPSQNTIAIECEREFQEVGNMIITYQQ